MAYIEKDLLLKDIGESVVFSVRAGYISPELRGARKIIDRIENAPTADVVKVKHEKWILRGNEKKCSGCKFIYYSNKDEWNYCPNCGAEMNTKK